MILENSCGFRAFVNFTRIFTIREILKKIFLTNRTISQELLNVEKRALPF